mgnify:CR=1 FL=1
MDKQAAYTIEVIEAGRDETTGLVMGQGYILGDGVRLFAYLIQPGYTPALWSAATGALVTDPAELAGAFAALLLAVMEALSNGTGNTTPGTIGPDLQQRACLQQRAWVAGLDAGFAEIKNHLHGCPPIETKSAVWQTAVIEPAQRRIKWLKSLAWPEVAEEVLARGR